MQHLRGTLDETGETPDCSRGYEAVGIWAVKRGRFGNKKMFQHSLAGMATTRGEGHRCIWLDLVMDPMFFRGNLTQLLIN